MKLVTFSIAAGSPRSGALIERDEVVDLQAAHAKGMMSASLWVGSGNS